MLTESADMVNGQDTLDAGAAFAPVNGAGHELDPESRPVINGAEIYGNGQDFFEVKPGLDPARGVFLCRDGQEFILKPIKPAVIQYMTAQRSDAPQRPKPPIVQVKVGKSGTAREPNPNDPTYKELLTLWEVEIAEYNTQKGMELMVFLFSSGVVGDPPEDEIADFRDVNPNDSERGYKYLWVVSHLEDDSEMSDLTVAICSQTVTTEKGLEDAGNFTA